MSSNNLFFDIETKDKFAEADNVDYYHKSPVDICHIVEKGFILPAKKNILSSGRPYFQGGVVDDKNNFIEGSKCLRKDEEGALLESYDFNQKHVEYIDKDVLYAGILINHFGHFLVESSNRLWYWLENRDKNLDIVFLITKNAHIFPQFWEFMQLLGIEKDKIHIVKRVTQFRTVYVPFQSHVIRSFYTNIFLVPLDNIRSVLPDGKKQKVYLSRTKLKNGTVCLGEQYIEKLFRDNGYRIVYPEKISLKEQFSIIKNSSELAGVSGTAMHLALCADKHIPITILERTDVPEIEQIIINQALQAQSYHVGVNLNPFPVNHSVGPILLGVSDNLVAYCKDRRFNVNLKFVNFINKSDARRFASEYFRKYCQKSYNRLLSIEAPLVARRMLLFSGAFIPLKRLIKEKFRAIRASLGKKFHQHFVSN